MSELREMLEDAFSVRIGALLTGHDRIKDKFDEYKERGRAAVEKKDEKKDVLSILDDLTDEEKKTLKEALLNGSEENS